MNALSSEERRRLTAYLETHATDDVLVGAVADTVEAIARSKSEYKRLSAQLGTLPKPVEGPARVAAVAPAPIQSNVPPPPGTPASRIGAVNKLAIETVLKRGPATPRDINAGINGKTDNTHALLKLLWQRGAIQWDGERYSMGEVR